MSGRGFKNVISGVEHFPKHILEAIEGKTAGDATFADVSAYVSGSVAIVITVLQSVAKADLDTLKSGMVASGEAAFNGTTGSVEAKLAAAGAAALATGIALLSGDLKDAFAKISAALAQQLLHTFATDAAGSAGIATVAA